MLRALVLLLLLANGLLWAWGQGWLAPLLAVPGQEQREPARLQRQLRPDAVRLLEPRAAHTALGDAVRADEARARQAEAEASATSVPSPPSPPSLPAAPAAPSAASTAVAAGAALAPGNAAPARLAACWEAGPLDAAQLPALERAARDAATGLRWAVRRGERGGQFIVYMGRYTDRALLLRKQDELRRLGVPSTEVADSPSLTPGLQLGPQYNDRAAAGTALAELGRQGVKTARLAMLVAPTPLLWLRTDGVLPAQAERLATLPPLGPGQHRLAPCG